MFSKLLCLGRVTDNETGEALVYCYSPEDGKKRTDGRNAAFALHASR